MSALEAFNSIWNQARAVYGEGVPVDGTRYDKSAQFREFQSQTQSAAPGAHWTGAAADKYSDANDTQARKFGQMAQLDRELGKQVTRSADAVLAGRRDLEAVRQWVNDATTGLPKTAAGDAQMYAAVAKGSGEIADIIKRTHGEMVSISSGVDKVKAGWDALSDRKEAGGPGDKDGKGEIDKITGDKPDEKKPTHEEIVKAQQDVSNVLKGKATPEELQRVNSALSLSPQQQTDYDAGRPVNLSDQQKLILGQMQNQMHGMSVADIRKMEQQLPQENRGLVGNALQMMSSDKFSYTDYQAMGPLGELTGTFQGGADKLPVSVQNALTQPAAQTGILSIPGGAPGALTSYPTIDDLHALAGIVQDGNPALQHGTYLDRGLLDRGSEMLAAEQAAVHGNYAVLGSNQHEVDPTVQDIFRAAGRDTIVDHDILTGPGGHDLLQNMSTHDWADNGNAASTLTNWIHGAADSPDPTVATRAGETAQAVANYLGDPGSKLLDIPTDPFTHGHTTVGQLNPDLVRGYADALTPYQNAMVGDYSNTKGFHALDDFYSGQMSHTREIFAVMDSDYDPKNQNTASNIFNSAAYAHSVAYEQAYGQAAAENKIGPSDPHSGDMGRAGALAGLVEAGTKEASGFNATHNLEDAKSAYNLKKSAIEYLFSQGTSQIPVVGGFLNAMGKDQIDYAFLGEEPKLDSRGAVQFSAIQVAQNQADFAIASQLVVHDHNSQLPSEYINPANGQLRGPDEIAHTYGKDALNSYYSSIRTYIDHSNASHEYGRFREYYDNVTRG